MDGRDMYFLFDGSEGRGGFEEIGYPTEKVPLVLRNVISYDEIKLSALLSVSSHTEFINDGSRYNCGQIEADKTKIEAAGVVIGLIGSRFTRRGYMEWQDIMITANQNTSNNGYGAKTDEASNRATDYRRIWNNFYEEQDFLYEDARKLHKERLFKTKEEQFFDNLLMKKRFTISFDTLLLEAEARAEKANTFAYVHVVGIGLGVWRVLEHQTEIFLETFSKRIKDLMQRLQHVGVVHFSWFYMTEWGDLKDGGIYVSETHPKGGIKTFLSNRNPSQKLPAEYEGMLVVESYAWDGNAMPGNEFWTGSLCGSGDPAAACSTLITELHNPYINNDLVNGNKLELAVYPQLTLTDLVQRLLQKRCVAFVGANDSYILLDGSRGCGDEYENIGTPAENYPLVLNNVISYDEVKLSALLSVSSFTEFLNDGSRHNSGRIEHDKSKIETEGVIIGLIGGRFERANLMEWQDILITKEQNTRERGYGFKTGEEINKATDFRRVWNYFYESKDFLYDEVKNSNDRRFFKKGHDLFDNVIMKKRYAIPFDTLLIEANARAEELDKLAYVHVVGIGLGVWMASSHQKQIFLQTFAERIKALMPRLNHVGVVHFSHFGVEKFDDLEDCGIFVSETHPKGGIKIFMHNRNPASKLASEFQNMFVVESYSWDGNALPGNEFWMGSLSGSGDPAAACSTLITELHNPHINTELANGKNLHIASLKYGVMHIKDFCRDVLKLF